MSTACTECNRIVVCLCVCVHTVPCDPPLPLSPQIRVVRAFQASVRESSNIYLSAVQDFTKTPYAIQRKAADDGQTTTAEGAGQGTSV